MDRGGWGEGEAFITKANDARRTRRLRTETADCSLATLIVVSAPEGGETSQRASTTKPSSLFYSLRILGPG